MLLKLAHQTCYKEIRFMTYLSSEMLLDSDGVIRSPFDGGIIGDDEAFGAGDPTNSGYDAPGRNLLLAIKSEPGQL